MFINMRNLFIECVFISALFLHFHNSEAMFLNRLQHIRMKAIHGLVGGVAVGAVYTAAFSGGVYLIEKYDDDGEPATMFHPKLPPPHYSKCFQGCLPVGLVIGFPFSFFTGGPIGLASYTAALVGGVHLKSALKK